MRVISPAVTRRQGAIVRNLRGLAVPRVVSIERPASRAANIELLGLAACSVVVLFGLLLTLGAREIGAQAGSIDLHRLASPDELLPVLTMFDEPFERLAVARAVYQRASIEKPPLEHVGGLAAVTLPALEIQKDRRYLVLRSRLERRPGASAVPAFTSADIAAIKPELTVRSEAAFRSRVRTAVLGFFAAFWLAHAVRRWQGGHGDAGAHQDPVVLPILLLLSGIGLMTMLALRDPLRDTVAASGFAGGVVGGLVLLTAASTVDFEASPLRRAVIAPLALALGLAALLLVFGSGPGSSGVKVNLLGFQPVEAIRLLVVLGLGAYFARRLEFLREFSEPPTPSRPWLRYVRVPRWKDVRPVVVSISLVLAFFFLQKDLGPALVLACVFLALYGIARGRAAFVVVGFALVLFGFAAAYWIGIPATVRQRVMIWFDPWNNGVPGGNQIAHGLWALSTGAFWGSGSALGGPQAIPAGHTDFVLAAIGEELGFAGLAVVFSLYAMLCWRCLRTASRAPGDYTAFLATGLALALVVQAFVIGSGLLGLVPLSGVVTPFLSYGRSSMLANFLAIGIVMGISRRRGPVRQHLRPPIRVLAAVMAVAAVAVASRAAWIQVVRADEFATAASLSEQADGRLRFEYNPRLLAAARSIVRGSIYDRNGLPLATSRPEEIRTLGAAYRKAGIVTDGDCSGAAVAADISATGRSGGGAAIAPPERCYPLAGVMFHVVGDWTTQANWGARNSSYVERDQDAQLKGYDDRAHVVDVVNPRTGAPEHTVKRDFRTLLPLVRSRYRNPSVLREMLERPRDIHTSIDARLQTRTAAALKARIEGGRHARGAAVVLDVATGDVLASVSYPWPVPSELGQAAAAAAGSAESERLLDRPRYGLYPPGSTFKLLVAGAALRSNPSYQNDTFMCVPLPDGRVGNFVRGSTRPIRDDPMDKLPHGSVDLRHGLIVSCNAYFAQLAVHLGPKPLLDAASLFQVDVARPATAAGLQRSLPQAGYGQGQVIISPLKMARIAASIGGQGVVQPVRWGADDMPNAGVPQRFVSTSDAALLSRYMREVVTSGTGRTLRSNSTEIAGKTGTAEVGDGTAHSWFAGFAPYGTSPRRIAFAVLVENAGYGAHEAAPIAGEVVTAAREIGLFGDKEVARGRTAIGHQ
jgi:cell division protein FtsW (lipid II flippase)/cell division protein FtsI/penicillin-binding protein 2